MQYAGFMPRFINDTHPAYIRGAHPGHAPGACALHAIGSAAAKFDDYVWRRCTHYSDNELRCSRLSLALTIDSTNFRQQGFGVCICPRVIEIDGICYTFDAVEPCRCGVL